MSVPTVAIYGTWSPNSTIRRDQKYTGSIHLGPYNRVIAVFAVVWGQLSGFLDLTVLRSRSERWILSWLPDRETESAPGPHGPIVRSGDVDRNCRKGS